MSEVPWKPRGGGWLRPEEMLSDLDWKNEEEVIMVGHGGKGTSARGGVPSMLAHSRHLLFLLPSGPGLSRVPEVSGDCGGPLWLQGV